MKSRFSLVTILIKENKLALSFTLVFVAFAFSRLPFFLWYPLVDAPPDTFQYFQVVEQLHQGVIPDITFIPIGYPLFCFLLGSITDKLMAFPWVQSIIFLLAALLQIWVVHRFIPRFTLPVAVSISLYMMDSFSLRYDFTLITESIYRSSLLVTSALVTAIFFSTNKGWWISLGCWLVVPALIRSNGIYVYVIIFLVFFLVRYYQKPNELIIWFLTPFLLLNLSWASYNYGVSGSFSIGNFSRVKYVTEYTTHKLEEENNENADTHKPRSWVSEKATLFWQYYTYPATDLPQFYYSLLPTVYHQLYEGDMIHSDSLRMQRLEKGDWQQVPESMRRLVFKDYYNKENAFSERIEELRSGFEHPLWLDGYHLFYKLHSIFVRNIFFVILFSAATLLSLVGLIKKNKQQSMLWFILFFWCAMHILALFVISIGHSRFQIRYGHVSEFWMYLPIAIVLTLIWDNRRQYLKK